MSIGLWDITAPGGLRVAKSQVGALLGGGTSARRSEYTPKWVDAHHLLVCFESASVARKCYKQLSSMGGRSGAISWRHPIQWWPEEPDWAAYQLHLRQQAQKDEARLQKEERARQALLKKRRADAIKFAQDSQRHSGRDAWGDDDDTGGGGGGGGGRRR